MSYPFSTVLTRRISASLICLLFGLCTQPLLAQNDTSVRPPTEDLLPETTVAFVQIDNIHDFIAKMSESSMGRLMQDNAIASLRDGLWGEAQSAYTEFEDEIGVSLEDLQSFPAGELTFAVIVPRRQDPEFMLIIQTDQDSDAVNRVLDRGRELVQEEGQEIETEESDDGIEFESFTVEGKKIKLFRKEGLLVASTSEPELTSFVDRWMGREVEKVRPLSQNRKFVTIMNRCLGTQSLKPEARFFADPIAIAKGATRGNAAAQLSLNFLPVFGLDGLLGIGGSMLLSEDEFAAVTHGHLLLAEPRKGVFEMLAFKPTDYQPETWLPKDISNYYTTSWDVDQMLAELTKIIESFQGEGAVDTWFENVDGELEFDVREELLGGLTGRVTWAQWMEPPMRLNSQVNAIALELNDPSKFEETIDKIIARANRDADENPPISSEDYKGIRILGPSEERIEEQFEKQRERRRQRRAERGAEPGFEPDISPPTPSFALVGNYLLLSPQSREFVRRAIDTDQGEIESLANNEDYQNIARKMTHLLNSDMPSGIVYANPAQAFRWMIELVQNENSQEFLSQQAAENKYVGGIKQAMDENPLPEFSELESYFQPQGGFMTSDETGFHFLIFELKPEE